jgi:hypothetical protein
MNRTDVNFILNLLAKREYSGRRLRHRLIANRFKRCFFPKYSLPAFYSLIALLEDLGLVEGFWHWGHIAGEEIKCRCFRLRNFARVLHRKTV